MNLEKQSDVTGDAVADALESAGVSFILTVPDWVQLPLHRSLQARNDRSKVGSSALYAPMIYGVARRGLRWVTTQA